MAEFDFETRVVKQTLLEWMSASAPIDRVMNESLREHRVGAAQRGLITQTIYDFVRYWSLRVDFPIKPENPAWLRALDDEIRKALQNPGTDWLQRHERAKPLFAKDPLKHLHQMHRAPDFMARELERNPAAWHEYLHSMLSEAPLTVRVNPLKMDPEKFGLQYAALGARKSAWIPHAYTFDKRWAITQDAGHQEGLFEIQDEHSQLVAWVARPQSNEVVLDLCAGAGGKTLHLASLMGNRGEVWAYDISRKKLLETQTRARRAGLTNVRVVDNIGTEKRFDLIVIDAPCSGLGTLRRSPDRLYHFTDNESRRLASVQAELLRQALGVLKPGGRLVYATCTVRPEENVHILRAALHGRSFDWSGLTPALEAAMPSRAADFLAAARATPAAALADFSAHEQFACLQWGPTSQTSGGLAGDGFFVSLVHSRE
ncbi:MAG: RsmB/NOP family class I SAM-dependent RNA methyltransferase [Bdellovibrionales bacterium]|nr:RsmB/NOP family class I SAM-dependent RNA methyltransferase [Bdellovibrionales bacterium]